MLVCGGGLGHPSGLFYVRECEQSMWALHSPLGLWLGCVCGLCVCGHISQTPSQWVVPLFRRGRVSLISAKLRFCSSELLGIKCSFGSWLVEFTGVTNTSCPRSSSSCAFGAHSRPGPWSSHCQIQWLFLCLYSSFPPSLWSLLVTVVG